jgi:hypothetical protein
MSMTDNENTEPRRARPNSDTADPTRAIDLKDNAEPRFDKSRTETDDPRRAKLRKDRD